MAGVSIAAVLTATMIMTATWYGGAHIGQPHSAHWQGAWIGNLSPVVTRDLPGVATNEYPLGTLLRIEALDTCHGREHPKRVAYARVLDRMAWWANGRIDAMPMIAEALGFGETFGDRDVGCLRTRVEVVRW